MTRFRFVTAQSGVWMRAPRDATRKTWHFPGCGVIYAVTCDGALRWYRDLAMDGTASWAAGSGNQIGVEWDQFSHVFAGEEGVLYAIRPGGELLWYKDELRDGTNGPNGERGWAPNSGNQIGVGWDVFTHVFPASGLIYGIHHTGEVAVYQDLKRDGTNGPRGETGWDPRWREPGAESGGGFDSFDLVFSGGWAGPEMPFVLYGVATNGDLLWYGDRLGMGYEPRSGCRIGSEWELNRCD